jgi:predicted phosphodiesterase
MSNHGQTLFEIKNKKCLAIHGSLQDEYWKAIRPCDDLEAYRQYDYVFSGHSHLPHYFAEYYKTDNPAARNQKKTIFLNPGSVGQPRNLCPMAQYAILDLETESITMARVPYDIKKEQSAFSDNIDAFYKNRLERGV